MRVTKDINPGRGPPHTPIFPKKKTELKGGSMLGGGVEMGRMGRGGGTTATHFTSRIM